MTLLLTFASSACCSSSSSSAVRALGDAQLKGGVRHLDLAGRVTAEAAAAA